LLGTAVRHDYLSPSSATEWELLGWEPVKVNGLLWKGLAPVIARRIRHTTIVDCDPHYEEAVRVVEKVFLKTKEWLDGFGQEASKE